MVSQLSVLPRFKLLQYPPCQTEIIMSNRIYRGLHGVEPCAGRKKIVNVRAAAIRASPMESCFNLRRFRSALAGYHPAVLAVGAFTPIPTVRYVVAPFVAPYRFLRVTLTE